MNDSSLKILLMKYLEGNISSEESIQLENFLGQYSNEELTEIINELLSDRRVQQRMTSSEIASVDFQSILHAIHRQQITEHKPIRKIKANLYIKLAAVAACLLAVGFIYLYVNKAVNQHIEDPVVELVDIEPAQALAHITLANGKSLNIDSTAVGLVYEENGIQVFRKADGEIIYKVDETIGSSEPEYITISTPKGGFSKVQLADGTTVALHAASELKYPVNFTKNSREVYAEGEILFEVAKDATRPFKVHSKKQTIEVLGTIFNLVSDEYKTKTTLLEGSVKIQFENKDYFLKPGQEAVIKESIQINNVHSEKASGIKNEQFVFENSYFLDILKEVENWYNIKFVFQTDDISNEQISGTVSRKVKLSELLKVLELNTNYKFEIAGRRVIVNKY